jgi:hypothetical protein
MAQVIEQEIAEFGRDELAGIWRSLCAMMMLRTANLLHCYHQGKKQKAAQQRTALRWLEGGVGTITFSSACETLDLDEEYAKAGLLRHAGTRTKPSINMEESGPAFGNTQPCHLSRRKSASFSSGPQFSTT